MSRLVLSSSNCVLVCMIMMDCIVVLFSSSLCFCFFFFSSRRRHTRFDCDWSSDVCSSDLIGGRDERPVGKQVMRAMQTAPIDLIGQTTLKELIALLRRARLLVTNDSGPMHLAAAVGTPVIALFGPTDPARTGPYGAGHTVLRSGVPCSPCFSRRCMNAVTMECLTSIAPQQVLETATRLVEQPLNVQNSLPFLFRS